MKKIVFITNLNVLGGTENNLVSIVTHPEFRSVFNCHIFSGTRPHPYFADRLTKAGVSITRHNTCLGVRAPGVTRNLIFSNHIKTVAPDFVVFWNHVAKSRQLEICKNNHAKTFFFERGTGWRSHDPQKVREFLSSVDIVLSNSYAGKKILELRWKHQGKCFVLPNAVRPEAAVPKGLIQEKHAGSPLRLGVAARLVAYKGAASAVLASRELEKKGVRSSLYIAGDGPEASSLKDLCKKLSVQAYFQGAVQDMTSFYNHIDVLICPSIREPFGTVVIEAQSMGCPVVCSAVDGLPEIVLHGKTGYVVEPAWSCEKYLEFVSNRQDMPEHVFSPGSDMLVSPRALAPEDIADAVIEVTRNPQKYQDMSRQAAEFALNNYNFEKYIMKLRDFLLQHGKG